eukprot:gene4483-6337_t
MKFVLEALNEWVKAQPNKKVWSFLSDSGDIVDEYSYQELENSTACLAQSLQKNHKLNKGDRILLVFFPGLDFMISLLACFKVGLIAVPVFPPDPRRLKKDLHHFISIQSSSGAKVVLSNSQYNFVKKIESLKGIFSSDTVKWPELNWIQVDEMIKKGKVSSIDQKLVNSINNELVGDDIAFLQYTSGSTSEPKGVMITHTCLAHNLTLIIKELKANIETVNVSWLPQYHDMGLIGSYLGLMYCGGIGYYLSPISFLKDPTVWITALSKYKGTHTQAPNFAFALVSRKFNEALRKKSNRITNLDLSSIEHMINAAEPVDYYALQQFYRTFQSYGLKDNVVFPTYGLAEHTVFVCSGGQQILTVAKRSLELGKIEIMSIESMSDLNTNKLNNNNEQELSPELQRIVGCGYPGNGEGVDVLIVNSDNIAVNDETVGEVWVNSLSKAHGYWNQPELSTRDFQAKLSSSLSSNAMKESLGSQEDSQNKSYLRTGDLGFMFRNELFICGRIKDLIIVRGSNHYPQDIERTAEQHQGDYLRAGCSAAFAMSKEGRTESVVYVAELKEGIPSNKFESIVHSIKEVIAKEHGLSLQSICLLKTKSVPKTTSGKIARSWCKRGFVEGSLEVLYQWNNNSDGNNENNDNNEQDESLIIDNNNDNSNNNNQKNNKEYSAVPTQSHDHDHNQDDESFTIEDIKLMSLDTIKSHVEKMIIDIANQSQLPLTKQFDHKQSLVGLGFDSLSIVQLKGGLENRFHCSAIPDEFMFTSLACVNELAIAVKNGELTDEQKQKLESIGTNKNNNNVADEVDEEGNTTQIPVTYKQPLCPWFTCCYC